MKLRADIFSYFMINLWEILDIFIYEESQDGCIKTPKQFKECAKSAVEKCIHEALKHGFVEEFKTYTEGKSIIIEIKYKNYQKIIVINITEVKDD